jgi:hypothetical protein
MEEFGTQKGGQGGPVYLRTADCQTDIKYTYTLLSLLALCPVLVKVVQTLYSWIAS